jgi:hypothetical protein
MTTYHEGPPINELVLTATGPATEGGRLPLSELARLASGLQASLERIALSIYGLDHRPGRRPREIVDAVRLDFVGFDVGSAVLRIARPRQPMLADDLLESSLSALENGLASLRRSPDEVPLYFSPQVINGLRDLTGGINPSSVVSIELRDGGRIRFRLDAEMHTALRWVRLVTLNEFATVVGRLHMGDFSPASLRCRIDTHGGSVLCDFDYDLRDTVLDAMDQLVIAHGTAELHPNGTIYLLHLAGLQVLKSAAPTSLETLAQEQGVRPIRSAEDLRGEPIDDFDSFLSAVKSARHGGE